MVGDALLKRNIENVVALWSWMGWDYAPDGGSRAVRVSSSWPHRCWLPLEASLEEIAALAEDPGILPIRGIVPVLPWPAEAREMLVQSLLSHQFKLRAELQAMVLKLDATGAGVLPELDFRQVEDGESLDRWTDVCSGAFGYAIDGAVIHRLAGVPDLRFYLAYCDGAPAATALTLQTGDTTGIHQVGVAPEFRGKGLARALMAHVMDTCYRSGAGIATLQASAAAVGIYRSIGFEPQFVIRTYRRDQPS